MVRRKHIPSLNRSGTAATFDFCSSKQAFSRERPDTVLSHPHSMDIANRKVIIITEVGFISGPKIPK